MQIEYFETSIKHHSHSKRISPDNKSYRNVCNMSFVSFALAVIFIIKHHSNLKVRTFVRTLHIFYACLVYKCEFS